MLIAQLVAKMWSSPSLTVESPSLGLDCHGTTLAWGYTHLHECWNLLCPCWCSPMPVYECCNVLWGYTGMIGSWSAWCYSSRDGGATPVWGYTDMIRLPWCFLNMFRHVSMTHTCHMVMMSHNIMSWVMLIQQKSTDMNVLYLLISRLWLCEVCHTMRQQERDECWFLRWGLGGMLQLHDACWWVNLRYESIKSGLFAVRCF